MTRVPKGPQCGFVVMMIVQRLCDTLTQFVISILRWLWVCLEPSVCLSVLPLFRHNRFHTEGLLTFPAFLLSSRWKRSARFLFAELFTRALPCPLPHHMLFVPGSGWPTTRYESTCCFCLSPVREEVRRFISFIAVILKQKLSDRGNEWISKHLD